MKFVRGLLRKVLSPLVKWEPVENPEEGYTILIGAVSRLAPIATANVKNLAKQNFKNLNEIIVVFDSVRNSQHVNIENIIAAQLPDLPVRFCYYSALQARLAMTINWGWVYAWMSWTIGLSKCKSRYAILHDLDALLVNPDLMEQRFLTITKNKDKFVGIRWYFGNGVKEEDELVTTFEMIFDAAHVREHFKPLDVFNHVTRYKDRSVDFDTFLQVQSQTHGRSIAPIDARQMLHPSQMLCQYTYYMSKKNWVPVENNTLLMIPYYLFLAGDDMAMLDLTADIQNSDSIRLPLLGKTMDARNITVVWAAWVREQIENFETKTRQEPDESVMEYLNAIDLLTERVIGLQSGSS
ncbi:MAG: hypothetical protein P8J86_09740 [Phycisphaerales bacterium]|nr:hypothetical protein [Phycisphaerales bacterium]